MWGSGNWGRWSGIETGAYLCPYVSVGVGELGQVVRDIDWCVPLSVCKCGGPGTGAGGPG